MVVNIKIMVFCDVMKCSLVDKQQRFGGTCFLILQNNSLNFSTLNMEQTVSFETFVPI